MTKPVNVHFSPTSDWRFSDDPVRLKHRDEIVYQREGGSPWRFTGATVTPHPSGLTVDVKENRVTIDDPCKVPETLCVVLTVLHENGTTYDSPDPQIINEPTKGFPDGSAPIQVYVAVGLVVGAIVGALIDANTGPLTSRGMLKGLVVGAVIGAVIGLVIGRMLAGGRRR